MGSTRVVASRGMTVHGARRGEKGCDGRMSKGSRTAGPCAREVCGRDALGCASVGSGHRSTSSSPRCRCVP
jgi:hypothetical protein